MGDNHGGRRPWWRRSREMFGGAEIERRPVRLAELVRRPDDEVAYKAFCEAYPAQHLGMERALGTSQCAFDRTTRQAVRQTLTRALRNVLDDSGPKSADYVRGYLDQELADVHAWLEQDRATAVARGLNVGLGLGALAGVLLLAVPLLAGVPALHLLGVTLGCGDRWGLLGVFAAGGVGALGAVLSVLVRLRVSAEELACRQATGPGSAQVPARQLARRMRHEGVYRVFVGWILATAVYLVLSGGIVPVVEIPTTAADVCLPAGQAVPGTRFWSFWCAIGFVAGFNERWAFGILRRDTPRKRTGST
ncbi:hypothetical protein [Streptomyces sp. SID13726]|uniref:hypothetical protein n=1 Tax=Streptomyces sp. SID13726 TaxID=2706058 RepID=UPI0013B77366|nr:hypothetical protein [Streptomyces sp. SID13726]NEB02697.1 hypothetical protein [Streptomyces sp. SID13726]